MGFLGGLEDFPRPFLSRHSEAFLDLQRAEELPAISERHAAAGRERRSLGWVKLEEHRKRPQRPVRQRQILHYRPASVIAHEARKRAESARRQQEQVARGARGQVDERQARRSRPCLVPVLRPNLAIDEGSAVGGDFKLFRH